MERKTNFKQTEIGGVPNKWRESRVGDHIELAYGDGLPERDRKKGAIPVFGSNGITGFHDKALVKGPGIIIGRKGTVGQVAFSKTDFWPIDTTYYVKIKGDDDMVFWYYFLNTLGLNQMNSHSAVPGLNRDNVYEITTLLPPLLEQHAISKILSDLDEKIELNHQMNKTLESIAQAIFKRWFVDFEFPDKNGKPYKSSGDKLVDSELGEIPEGWEVGKFSDVVLNVKDQLKPGDAINDRKYVPVESLPMKRIGMIEYKSYLEAQSSLIAFEENDILFGAMRAYFHRVNFAPFKGVTRTTAFVLRPNKPTYLSFALFLLNMDSSVHYANLHSKGSTMPYAVWDNSLSEMPVVLPPDELLMSFHNLIYPFLQIISLSSEENMKLSQIRDSLLPRLMSGKIRVGAHCNVPLQNE